MKLRIVGFWRYDLLVKIDDGDGNEGGSGDGHDNANHTSCAHASAFKRCQRASNHRHQFAILHHHCHFAVHSKGHTMHGTTITGGRTANGRADNAADRGRQAKHKGVGKRKGGSAENDIISVQDQRQMTVKCFREYTSFSRIMR